MKESMQAWISNLVNLSTYQVSYELNTLPLLSSEAQHVCKYLLPQFSSGVCQEKERIEPCATHKISDNLSLNI